MENTDVFLTIGIFYKHKKKRKKIIWGFFYYKYTNDVNRYIAAICLKPDNIQTMNSIGNGLALSTIKGKIN